MAALYNSKLIWICCQQFFEQNELLGAVVRSADFTLSAYEQGFAGGVGTLLCGRIRTNLFWMGMIEVYTHIWSKQSKL
jgi:hypothetical protein